MPTRPRHRRRTVLSAAAASVAAITLGGSLQLAPAHADGLPGPASIAALDATHTGEFPSPSPSAKAIAEAKRTGREVPIPELTTEYSQTVATPGGHLRESRQVTPQRLKRDGGWVPLDDTLAPESDGTLAPKAASSGLKLSGGGNGPLATMTNPGGQQISIGAPFTLPKPVSSANSALYPEVLPGVDLKVTATKEGGFSTVLVVKNATAGANPALRKLRWPTKGKGVKVSADGAGNISARDRKTDTVVFSAPAPLMWDSSSAPATVAHRAAAPAAAATPAPSGGLALNAGVPSAPESSPQAPGEHAKVAAMPTTADDTAVELTPSQDLLTSPSTKYPVYVDPAWMSTNAGFQSWAWVQKAYPDRASNGSNGGDTNHLGVGFCGSYQSDPCSPTTWERSYYEFNVSALHGAIINDATLTANEYSSANTDCTASYPVSVFLTGGIDSTTTWATQPSNSGVPEQTLSVGASGGSACYGNVPVPFGVKNAVTKAAAGSWDHIAFGLFGDETNFDNPTYQDALGFKYFNASPTLNVTYDVYPDTPSNPRTGPATPHTLTAPDLESCSTSLPTSAFGWLTSDSVQLQTTLTTKGTNQLNEWVHLWDNTGAQNLSGWSSGTVSSGNVASYQFPAGTLKDGHWYGWEAFANDGIAFSPKITPCHFAVDLTAPTIVVPKGSDTVDLTLNQFPPSGNGQANGVHVGQTGYLKATITDPSPGAGLLNSGLANIRWGYDPNPGPNSGWKSPSDPSITSAGLAFTPTHWGTNVVYIQARDNAGNVSAAVPYSFYVPWTPTPLAFGDISGDGRGDVVAADPSSGNLLDYSQGLTFHAPSTVPGMGGAATPSVAATAAQAPNQKSWSGFRVSHRGTKDGLKPVDDLFVHQEPDTGYGPTLYYYDNNLTTPGVFNSSQEQVARPFCVESATAHCADYGDQKTWYSWSAVSQITPIGSRNTQVAPSDKPSSRTGFLAVQGGNLWYYPAGNATAGAPGPADSTGTVSASKSTYLGTPVEVSNDGSWGNYDLMIPGDALNTVTPSTPTLWARARSTVGSVQAGQILQFPLTFGTASDSGGSYTTITAVSSPTTIGTGFTTDYFPVIGSSGDLTGDNVPDIWAQNASTGLITTWAGVATGSQGTVTGFSRRTDQWVLSQTVGNTWDAALGNPLTPTGTVSWSTDAPSGEPGSVRLDGGIMPARVNSFDTKGAYTVSAWVKIDNKNSFQTFVSQAGTNMGAFYLQYNQYLDAWSFLTTASDAAGQPQYIAHSDPTTLPVVAGQWTHLVGTYDPSGTLTLYVNGKYAGSAGVSNPSVNTWTATGALTIGGVQLADGTYNNQTTGNIADVRTYPYTLTKDQVTTIYNNQ